MVNSVLKYKWRSVVFNARLTIKKIIFDFFLTNVTLEDAEQQN